VDERHVQRLVLRPLPRDSDEPLAAVDADHARTAPGQLPGIPTFAASEIEKRLATNVAEHREHVRHQVLITVVVGIGVCDPVIRDAVPGAC